MFHSQRNRAAELSAKADFWSRSSATSSQRLRKSDIRACEGEPDALFRSAEANAISAVSRSEVIRIENISDISCADLHSEPEAWQNLPRCKASYGVFALSPADRLGCRMPFPRSGEA